MIGNLTTRVLIMALIGLGAAGGTHAAQVAQNQAEDGARRAAEEADYGAERARDDDRQEILDAQEQARRDALLKKEESDREVGAADANRKRSERKTRLKALIEK